MSVLDTLDPWKHTKATVDLVNLDCLSPGERLGIPNPPPPWLNPRLLASQWVSLAR